VRSIRAVALAIIMTWILRRFYTRWLGGITGDLIGAAGEILEAGVLIAFTA
jgi:cobalamin synthase